MSAASGLIILEIPENNELGYNALEIIHESENNTPALKFTHASWYYGGAYSSLNYSGKGLQAGIRIFNSGTFEIRSDRPSDEPVATSAYYSGVIYGKWSKYLKSSVLTIRGNILFERMYYAGATGLSADISYRKDLGKSLKFAASARNIGAMNALDQEATSLPFALRSGIIYSLPYTTLSLAGGYHIDGLVFMETGVAVNYNNAAFVNFSWSSLYEAFHISPRIRWEKYDFSFGKYFKSDGLDSPYMISFSMELE